MQSFTPIEAVATVLLAGSLAFTLAAVVGLLRLPDFYTRLHAVGKCDTAGLALAAIALALLSGGLIPGLKLIAVWVLLALANPTATHALARAARRAGVPVWTAKPTGAPSARSAPAAPKAGGASR